jgi:hypothetical protein
MNTRIFALAGAAVAVLALAAPSARAERVRYHYTAADLAGNTALVPAPSGAPGQRVSYFGLGAAPYCGVMRPTYMVTFYNPVTKCRVTVPLALPDDTPRLEYRPNRVTFDYGTYYVTVTFLADGSVDVTYDNGLFKKLQ